MGILVHDNIAINDCLSAFGAAYRTGDFDKVIEMFADGCIYESQWVKEKLCGKQRIAEYLTGKGKVLIKTGCFPNCSMVQLYDPCPGRLGMIIKQNLADEKTKEEKENETLFMIEMNEDEKINHISLLDPLMYKYEEYYLDVVLWGGRGTKSRWVREDDFLACITENMFDEMNLFLYMVDGNFDEYASGFPCATIRQWEKALQTWKLFCRMTDYDSAIEKLAGINYKRWIVKNSRALDFLTAYGGKIWNRRKAMETVVDSLVEWTDTIRATSDHIFHEGW